MKRGQTRCAPRLERLENRLAFDAAYFTITRIEDLAGYEPASEGVDLIVGMSDDARYLWSFGAVRPDLVSTRPFLIVRREVRYIDSIPGLEGLRIADINSQGVAVGQDEAGRQFLYDIEDAGTRVDLTSLITTAPDGFDASAVRAVMIGDAGAIVLTEKEPGLSASVWVLQDGAVELAWEHTPSEFGVADVVDIDATNTIAGHRSAQGDRDQAVTWSRAGGLVALTGLDTVGAINTAGLAVGKVLDRIMVWDAGSLRETGMVDDPYDGPYGHSEAFTPIGIDASGVVLASVNVQSGRGTWTEYRLADDFVSPVDDRLVGPNSLNANVVIQGESGAMGGTFALLDKVSLADLLHARAGHRATVVQDAHGAYIGAYNVPGSVVTFTTDGAAVRWGIDPRSDRLGGLSDAVDVIGSYIDPGSGAPVLLVLGEFGGIRRIGVDPLTGRTSELGALIFSGDIVSGVTTFTSGDRRAQAAGLTKDGDVQLHYQARRNNGHDWWWWANLSKDHVRANAGTVPALTGELASLSTPWGGMNVVGLDASGDVWSVWWAPGLTFWRATNLSEVAGAPRLTGNLAVMSTSWGGLHVLGTDEAGHVRVLWWSPALGPGNWRTDDLTVIAGGPSIEAGSLAGFATPWRGLSVFGRDGSGEVAALWWAPGGDWVSESVTAELPAESARIAGSLSAFIGADGTQNIAGVTESGEVVRMFWMLDGTDAWRVQNLTVLAGG